MPDDATLMTDRDIDPAAATDALVKAIPVKDGAASAADEPGIRDRAATFGKQAADQARRFADDGKARASGALGQLARMLTDAAGTVDEKLGSQYGDYARQAAGSVSGFADRLDAKNVDDIVADARDFIRKSPGAAIGIAAALGFVLARAVQSGIDDKA